MSPGIPCLATIAETRKFLAGAWKNGTRVGMVPTMGALHEGHLSLVRAARAESDVVVVSIFVNPTQFGPGEDLEQYPRDLGRDRLLCEKAGADLIFCPSPEEMYPDGYSTWVEVEDLTAGLCGRSRQGHFRGVCTVVAKLFNVCQPDQAYFGEKDAQQLAVITRMVRDLNMSVQIVSCPTVREPDGLAMSSRNARLSPEQREQAPALFEALSTARQLVQAGERDAKVLDAAIRSVLRKASLGEIDYVEIADAASLRPMATIAGECLMAVAVRFGDVRLIDNVRVSA